MGYGIIGASWKVGVGGGVSFSGSLGVLVGWIKGYLKNQLVGVNRQIGLDLVCGQVFGFVRQIGAGVDVLADIGVVYEPIVVG